MQRVLENEPYYKDIDKTYAETYKYLTQYSGDNITSLSDIGDIFDTLFIENEFEYDLPPWTEAVFPEPLTTLGGYLFQSLGYSTTLARLGAGTFLNEVIDHFEKMRENPSSGQFFRMYSAHDNNIVQILSALGAYEPHAPYYASSIYFELRQANFGVYHVNIYYKQKDVIQKITPRGCFQFDCNLNNLKNQLSDVLINSDTWAEECAS
ncbi:lysosomal acid phosphatase-like [Leptinotarsa decemlineata]|uniref:lysosomal acid phosphatase-like n=1 Tax=Leptinotarsa decemlineata TaxID=7539 RepID=UPI003D305FFD